MEEWKDYYKVLQVHHQAEPEVIEGAFKRLAKKYHPDVCGTNRSGEMMKAINEAYGVLRDPARRQMFHRDWVRKHTIVKEEESISSTQTLSVESAKRVLTDYLRAIQRRDYEYAYRLISAQDKSRIPLADFITWQESVSTIFAILEFENKFCQMNPNLLLEERSYKEIAEFNVKVIEKNIIMDRKEKGEFLRKTVRENDTWSVFLGYKEVRSFTEKFQRLAGLITVKSVVQELSETHSKIDHPTGLLNQKGFFERAENEMARYNRYKQAFTLILCRIDEGRASADKLPAGQEDSVMKSLGEMITSMLRNLDVVARWEEKSLIILLPQSNLQAGLSVAEKIRKQLSSQTTYNRNNRLKITMSFGVAENAATTLEACIRRVQRCLDIARKHGGQKIASSNGML